MDPTKKLVIPEINADVLTKDDKIIANPNCSTIQMLVMVELHGQSVEHIAHITNENFSRLFTKAAQS